LADPTAVHAVVLMQSTPASLFGAAFGTLASVDQAEPFQVSMRF
jgi:hypothetical protein